MSKGSAGRPKKDAIELPTVASLCSVLGKHLTPVAGFRAHDVEVTAVHISELVDPNAYLSGGELLLTTGLALPKNKIGCRRYVSRLMEAGVSALALGLGPVHDSPPLPLVDACQSAGLTLLTVPAPTPFLTISRAYWTARSRSTEQRLNDAVAAHRALVDAAVAPDPAAAILRRLARLLEGWVALLDAAGRVDQVYPPSMIDGMDALGAEVARLQGAGLHSSASFNLDGHVVVVFPLAVENTVVGYLAAGSPRQMEPPQRRVVLTAAALLSLDAVRDQRTQSAQGAMRRCVALLIDAGMIQAARLLAAEEAIPMPRQEASVLVTRGRDSADLVQCVQRWCPDALTVAVDRTTVWSLLPDWHDEPSGLVEGLLSVDPTVAVTASELTSLERVGPTRARLVQAVGTLEPGQVILPRSTAVEGLRQAIESFVVEASVELRDALVTYLRHRGQWEQTSKELGLHRNTVRYRVTRARELLGLDLDDPDVAAETWLALRAKGVA